MTAKGTFPPMPTVTRKSGRECFSGIRGAHTLQDFWEWAFSDVVGNTVRGKLAEYIVATAVGCESDLRPTWESFDLLSPEGIKIEVKSSAYLQSWEQKGFSQIQFSIAESGSENGSADAAKKKRQAHVYVFCVLKHKDPETLNPLDLAQWDFYPVATLRLNACFKQQKSLALGSLRSRCKAVACPYTSLKAAIEKEYAYEKSAIARRETSAGNPDSAAGVPCAARLVLHRRHVVVDMAHAKHPARRHGQAGFPGWRLHSLSP